MRIIHQWYLILSKISRAILRQYILGLLLEMAIVATIACTAFWIIGVKYAVLLGLIVGLFNIIPYLGIFTALLLSSFDNFCYRHYKPNAGRSFLV